MQTVPNPPEWFRLPHLDGGAVHADGGGGGQRRRGGHTAERVRGSDAAAAAEEAAPSPPAAAHLDRGRALQEPEQPQLREWRI